MSSNTNDTECDKWGSATAAAHGPLSHAIVRLARVHRVQAAHLLRELGLYPGQELMLMRLWEQDDQSQGELAKVLGVDASTATKTLQRLEQAGVVTRRPAPTDRRSMIVSLTAAGRELAGRIADVWGELETRTTAGLSDDDKRVALRLLERLEDNLCDSDECPTELSPLTPVAVTPTR
ncbi:MarR family winged helix-turn-helix transcriptional regulator [Nocardioides speluncae]|uniref:MarR family winged helix-turn-helix transcriptional regulator n=1 Tax=Nocardioides speluncae TaxID=2670337 RepID=UPI000D695C5C|nr:MarR family winged helix-turn-helix transcriptional regulator [Nocardioides speluncae]